MKPEDLDGPDGAALLDELRTLLLRYVVFPSAEAADAMTLWIAATHAQTAWEHAPRAATVSPEKRCGKSRLMDVAEGTCYDSLVTVNISSAALVRAVSDEDPPTLFIDEADTIFGPKAGDNHEDLRGIINAGYQRGRPYIRYDITRRCNESLPTFSMAMLAGIGDLPDTIMDRAVVIRMRRRAPGENVAPYRTRRDRPALHDLRDRLTIWARKHLDRLRLAEPKMPVEDRAADTWEPLIAMADLAGAHWPKRGRKAALVLVNAEASADAEASLGARLLSDIKDTFESMSNVSFLPSAELASLLLKIGDAPWREFGARGDGLTQRTLATQLKPYGVNSRHNAAKTARGYHRDDFKDPFDRYLTPKSVRASEKPADQGERPDGSQGVGHNKRPPDRRPDTSNVRPETKRPAAPAAQDASTDARTLPDAQVSTDAPQDAWIDGGDNCPKCSYGYESIGHRSHCE